MDSRTTFNATVEFQIQIFNQLLTELPSETLLQDGSVYMVLSCTINTVNLKSNFDPEK